MEKSHIDDKVAGSQQGGKLNMVLGGIAGRILKIGKDELER